MGFAMGNADYDGFQIEPSPSRSILVLSEEGKNWPLGKFAMNPRKTSGGKWITILNRHIILHLGPEDS
jgi:hypothetical protein